jgi:hypothetical protein
MKANELRIGNLAYIDWLDIDTGKWHQKEHEITYRDLWNLENGNELVKQSYDPIPLTEEWHNKFGVIKNGFESFEYVLPRKNNISLKVIFTGDYVMLKQGEGTPQDDIVSIWNKDITKRDMFVHEWQNLYFALTGEELTLNP